MPILKPNSPKSPASLERTFPDKARSNNSPTGLDLVTVVRNLNYQFTRLNEQENYMKCYNSEPVELRLTVPQFPMRLNYDDIRSTVLKENTGESRISEDLYKSPPVKSGGELTDCHVCPECGKRYSTSSNLARHRQTHRSITDKKARKCPHCDKVYVSMPAFSMHVRTHNQGCRCHHCGKCFSRPWLLQGHIRTHTGEKPFQCPTCKKAFADKSNLRAHVQTHSNTKPYVCARCGKAFALKSYLYKHEESSCLRLNRYLNTCVPMQKCH